MSTGNAVKTLRLSIIGCVESVRVSVKCQHGHIGFSLSVKGINSQELIRPVSPLQTPIHSAMG